MADFESLVECRARLNRLCESHWTDLHSFRFREPAGTVHKNCSFKLHWSERSPQASETTVRHLTSTATCINSLLLTADNARDENPVELARAFAGLAARTDEEAWISDGSAQIYCRCRTLPLVIRYLSDTDEGVWNTIKCRTGEIFEQLRSELLQGEPERFAIGEAWVVDSSDHEEWYPPNAFHTYWSLDVLDVFAQRAKELPAAATAYKSLANDYGVRRLRAQFCLWAERVLAQQIVLHNANSAAVDSDQLGWSLAIFARFSLDNEGRGAPRESRELIASALRCLFGTQQADGSWRVYAPLFHYLKVGNAHCFVFETFARLLEDAQGKEWPVTFATGDDPDQLVFPNGLALAKFVVLRWDELSELAEHLAREAADTVTNAHLEKALREMCDPRLANRAAYVGFPDRVLYRRDHRAKMFTD